MRELNYLNPYKYTNINNPQYLVCSLEMLLKFTKDGVIIVKYLEVCLISILFDNAILILKGPFVKDVSCLYCVGYFFFEGVRPNSLPLVIMYWYAASNSLGIIPSRIASFIADFISPISLQGERSKVLIMS